MVTGGRYPESLRLHSNVEIAGAFNVNTWMSDTANFNTVVDGGAEAIVGDGVMNVTLRDLTVESADATATGASSVSILLSASSGIDIMNTEIMAGNGMAGANSTDRPNGSAGARGGNGSNAGSNAGRGGTGGGGGSSNAARRGGDGAQGAFGVIADGSRGDAGNAGGSGALGGAGGAGAPSTFSQPDGSRGGNGRAGFGGSHGEPAPSLGQINGSTYQASAGTSGGSGASGGGGGSGGANTPLVPLRAGGGGGGGQGGLGGQGGGLATSGGASFGVVLVNGSQATIRGSMIQTGMGGDGGDGARGGGGGAGGAGGTGGNDGLFQGGGGNGGTGGPGGRGGDGGSGSGGPSVGILTDASSSFTGTNTFVLGAGGEAGGKSATNATTHGAPGLSQENRPDRVLAVSTRVARHRCRVTRVPSHRVPAAILPNAAPFGHAPVESSLSLRQWPPGTPLGSENEGRGCCGPFTTGYSVRERSPTGMR